MTRDLVLSALGMDWVEAVNALPLQSQTHITKTGKPRPVSDRQQRRVLKRFAEWKNDTVYLTITELADRWEIDEKTLRCTIAVLKRQGLIAERTQRGRRIRGVCWETLKQSLSEPDGQTSPAEPVSETEQSTGQSDENCPEPTGQFEQNCPEPIGQFEQNCPIEKGTRCPDITTTKNQSPSTTTTTPRSGEWGRLRKDLFDWGMKQAGKAVTAIQQDGWTEAEARELWSANRDAYPGTVYGYFVREDDRPFGRDEARRRIERKNQPSRGSEDREQTRAHCRAHKRLMQQLGRLPTDAEIQAAIEADTHTNTATDRQRTTIDDPPELATLAADAQPANRPESVTRPPRRRRSRPVAASELFTARAANLRDGA